METIWTRFLEGGICMMNYYFSLISTVCMSAVLITITVCIMSMMIAAARRVIRALNTPKPCKHVEGKKWKTNNIEINKTADKKEA